MDGPTDLARSIFNAFYLREEVAAIHRNEVPKLATLLANALMSTPVYPADTQSLIGFEGGNTASSEGPAVEMQRCP